MTALADRPTLGNPAFGDSVHQDSTPTTSALKPDGTPIKVLYALDSFPQLSESYINSEILRMQSWGVEIEAWSSGDPASPGGSDIPVHRGDLKDAIRKFKPDIVHTHWTRPALRYKDGAKAMGLPMTARGHWHFVPKQLAKIEKDNTIVRLFMFPHLAKKYASLSSKIPTMRSCFHEEWVAPRVPKDRRMVVRTAACKPAKDLGTFIRVAAKMPSHRFVLILCSLGPNAHYRELEELNRSLGSPVEMIRDISYQEVAKYLAEAGIYFHTYMADVSFGMPVSIAESMIAGCTVVARDVYGAKDYVGDAGRMYTSEEEAIALIKATENWSDEDWHRAETISRQRAAEYHDDRIVLLPLLEIWKEITDGRLERKPSVLGSIARWIGLQTAA